MNYIFAAEKTSDVNLRGLALNRVEEMAEVGFLSQNIFL
jgi:hypothetical protein